MAVRDILLFGDRRLRHKALPVDLHDHDWHKDARDLADTLSSLKSDLGFGRALAGPQIGSPFRLIAIECDLGRFVAVNPEITWTSDNIIPVWDDCFSLPGTCVATIRKASISFRCFDQDGKLRCFERLDSSHSELIQHEMDHLNGVLMIDRLAAPGAIIASAMASSTPHPALENPQTHPGQPTGDNHAAVALFP